MLSWTDRKANWFIFVVSCAIRNLARGPQHQQLMEWLKATAEAQLRVHTSGKPQST